MSIPWLPVFFKNWFLFITLPSLAVLSAVQMVSQSQFFSRFFSTLPDAFTLFSEKCAKF